MNNIENILYQKTVKPGYVGFDQQGADLFSFWTMLKKQLCERLTVVISIFPHYSLHDSSHSEKILDVIWKLYGEDAIRSLSVSNLFAILVSAYAHDLGMTVLSEDFLEVFDSKDFVGFIKKNQRNTFSPVYKYACFFEVKANALFYKANIKLNTDSYNAVKFLLSAYFRGKHADRSKGDIQRLFSQYKAFVKNSFSNQLGAICAAHNYSFKDVLTIPREENGIYGDSWNPLFVACSLRLGDLLDLESDRFSESYWETLSSKPFDAEYHRQKHEAIKHFVVNQNIIEATAECTQYEVYELLVDEFQMVKDEISNQMAHWSQIAPCKSFPSLPCLGEFSVKLTGYDTFDNGEIPSFHINQEKAFELIKGAGIYADKFTAIREILQNSVDATLIRCFIENEKDKAKLEFETFKNILFQERIFFSIKKKGKIQKDGNNYIIWTISIKDNGIGMDKKDLKYLLDAASASENPFRKDIVLRMPEWLKPSGSFGLGFQSIFQLSERIEVITGKVNSAYKYILTLESPANKIKNGVLLKKEEADFSNDFGTTVSFDLTVPLHPSSISLSIDDPETNDLISHYDFVTTESLDYEIMKVISAASRFASFSFVPIEFQIENNEPFLVQKIKKINGLFDRKYYEKYGIELFVPENRFPLKYLYRNVAINKSESNIKFIPFSSNILSGNAKELLKYDRDNFQNNKKVFEVLDNTIYAGREYILQNFDKIPDDLKLFASMYVRYYEVTGNSNDSEYKRIYNWWETKCVSYDEDNSLRFKEIIDFSGTIKLEIQRNGRYLSRFVVKKTKNGNNNQEIVISTQYNIPDEIHFLVKELLRSGKQLVLSKYDTRAVIFEITTPVKKGDLDFIKSYTDWLNNDLLFAPFYSRFTIPCNYKYKKLAVSSKNAFIPAEETFRVFRQDFPFGFSMPVMVSPYIIKRENAVGRKLELSNLEEVINFTYNNKSDETATMEEIRSLFLEFVKETIAAVDNANGFYEQSF